jgi:hypothetical protein
VDGGASLELFPAGRPEEPDPKGGGPMKASTGFGVPILTVFRVTGCVVGVLATSAPEPTATVICTRAVVPVEPVRLGFPVILPGMKVEMP